MMAFTSTAILCGEGAMTTVSRTHNSPLTISITAILGLTTLLAILFNHKGSRTWYALGLSVPGFALTLFSVIQNGGQPLYYAGIGLLFLGVWMNGSLPWLWNSLLPRRMQPSAYTIKEFVNGSAQVSGETRRN